MGLKMFREEYQNMQKHLLYITNLSIKDLDFISKIRGVEAVWKENENTACISFYFNEEPTEVEQEEAAVCCTEIIAHCSNAMLEENYIRWKFPLPLPESRFWAYKKPELAS